MNITTKNFNYDETAGKVTFQFDFSESMEECFKRQILARIAQNYLGNVYEGYASDFANGLLTIDSKKKEVIYKF